MTVVWHCRSMFIKGAQCVLLHFAHMPEHDVHTTGEFAQTPSCHHGSKSVQVGFTSSARNIWFILSSHLCIGLFKWFIFFRFPFRATCPTSANLP
jgi:hypothetical protein